MKFCKDFVLGFPFGEDRKRDVGERKKKAELILSKIIFEHCSYCEHWNTENIIRVIPKGEITAVYLDYDAAFCEIQGKPHQWKTPMQKFQTHKRSKGRS